MLKMGIFQDNAHQYGIAIPNYRCSMRRGKNSKKGKVKSKFPHALTIYGCPSSKEERIITDAGFESIDILWSSRLRDQKKCPDFGRCSKTVYFG